VGEAKSKGWSIEYRLPSIEEIEDDPSFIDDVLEYANSPEGLLYSEVSDTVSMNEQMSTPKSVGSSGRTVNASRLLHQPSALRRSIRAIRST
jgi:hypothetical protein